ncbi:conserved hypothetical protein [Theileria equi strain WA]|uniref:HIT-type domain-containing protein n=1 Tax=Theileria equi strain WA TaxID=1537102 RepID=L1LA32_THEEQ|nr:conserved hypothetical protein [Theileria equi strain WA]EKX72287.1 conserved hypothetical protein [Theileria equi strain WA]|eukprot:XP_004831739.1 conserved hypothetical protein [Theileria equi strain WA]
MEQKCHECGSENGKYRFKCCPNTFCSIACFKAHKCTEDPSYRAMRAQKHSMEPKPKPRGKEWITGLTESQMAVIRGDERMRGYLKNDTLRRVLTKIANSEDPVGTTSLFMGDQYFSDFITYTLKIINRDDSSATNM